MQRLRDEAGREIRLGEKLGEGGEGAVYRLAGRPGTAVKVYAAPLTADRAAKIGALSARVDERAQSFTAWPSGLVLDDGHRPRGLLLPVVEGATDVHNLYSPRGRRTHFPDADWRFLVHVATNVARAFGAVHAMGLVIGDVNHGSVLVARDGTVRLIDVDSFQVPTTAGQLLLCTVAVPLFTPPELHGASLSEVVRTVDHDAFGLAVLVFQLLMMGRHPYAGVFRGQGDMPIERAIVEHRFAYSRRAADRLMAPPPHSLGLELVPEPVANLFEAAFSPGAARRGRPSPADWVRELSALTEDLVRCRRSATHHYARSTGACPWCSFERATGAFLFGVQDAQQVAAGLDAEFEQLMKAVAAVPTPTKASAGRSSTAVAPSREAVDAAGMPRTARIAFFVVAPVLLFVGIALLPESGWLLPLCVLALATGGIATDRRRAPWRAAYTAAAERHERAVRTLQEANSFPRSQRARASITSAESEWRGLPEVRRRKYEQLEQNKRAEQLQQFLVSQRIELAGIPGVGPGRAATLSAYGIDTAADVDPYRISQVPSFGEVLTGRLVGWRRTVEQRFVFDPSRPLPKEAVARLEKDVEDARRRVVEQVRTGLRTLRDVTPVEEGSARAAAASAALAREALRQAEEDVKAATGKVPG